MNLLRRKSCQARSFLWKAVCVSTSLSFAVMSELFITKLRKHGLGAFAVGRGGSKSEELLMVYSIYVDIFC